MIIKVNLEEYESNLRLDAYLAEYLEDYSRSRISKAIKDAKVLVNGKECKSKYIVKENDEIELDLKNLEIPPILPEDISLDILYEDDHIAIINKPISMLTHPTATIRSNTLVNALLNRYDRLTTINGEERPGIIHRLDFNTSGLMIIALSDEAANVLKTEFQERSIVKRYRAICIGNFTELEGIIESPIGRNLHNRKLMQVREDGKYAKTGYKVTHECPGYSYINLDLFTGRTHQIRVHLASINKPILGDKDYGGLQKQFSINHQLLQAFYLKFNHPITNESMEFELEESSEIKKYKEILFKE